MTDVEVAIAVVEAGADVVRRCFGTVLQRSDKGGGDFATNADVEAEAAMLKILRLKRPYDSVVGEESGRAGVAHAARQWFLDPLSGTLNYAVRTRVAAVNVALQENERFLAAAVADPFNHEVYWTDMESAFVRAEGRDQPLSPDARSQLVDLNLDPPFPNAPTFRAVSLASDLGFTTRFRPRVVSSSIALAWVATGQRAAYVTDGDLRGSVHFAAGIAICQAAGCVVSDLRGFPVGHGPTGLLAAADPETHAALLGLIQKDVARWLIWPSARG